MLKNLFKKLFLIKEISSKNGELHFRRWRLLHTPIFSIYIHQIFKSDEDAHMHSHPFNYVTYLLRGAYYEENYGSSNILYGAGMVGKKHNSQYHRITVLEPTTTLVFAIWPRVPWGYNVDGEFVDHEIYRQMKNDNSLSG